MVIAIVVSTFLVLFGESVLPKTFVRLNRLMDSIDFTEVLMGQCLTFYYLQEESILISMTLKNSFGLFYIFNSGCDSTFVVGFGVYYIFPLVGVHIPFLYCLVFGALISPTDPVAVLSILKQAKVSKSLETKVAGESLFNDGMAVVVLQ